MTKTISLALLGTATMLACSPPGPKTDAPTEATAPEGEAAPPAGEGAGETGGAGPGGGGGGTAANLSVASVGFRNVGRHGDTLRVEVKGADTQKATSAAFVRFADEAGAPVVAVDTNWDGVPDAAGRRFHFDESTLGETDITGVITVRGAFGAGSKIRKAFVALEDETGGRSAEVEASIVLQVVKGEGQACDPAKVEDRCQAGMSCGGSPASCQPGVAPDLSKVAYFGGSEPRMLFRGSEPDEDLKSLTIEFLDASNNPKAVDLLDDGSTSTGITIDATRSAFDTRFFVESSPVASFASLVPRIAVTASDLAGRASARVIAAATTTPVRAANQACDPDGFDKCGTNFVCAPGLPDVANKCTSAVTLRSKRCTAHPALDPKKGLVRAFGKVEGASLWDAPPGCVPNDAKGRPEAAIPLRLDAPASTLTITTALPETDFDTAVYLIPSCAASSSNALGCNDDEIGFASRLVLKDVPAGDYTIVVESISMRGGRFGVEVEAK